MPDVYWNVIHNDASQFDIPNDATLFFLYNPFGPPVIDVVAQQILEFANSVERSVIVIYVNPMHSNVFEQQGFTRMLESNREVAIFRNN